MRVPRVLRGIVRTAVAWSVVWVPMSMIPFGIRAAFGGFSTFLTPQVVGTMLISQAIAGAINGAVFASVLALRGRRRTFESLNLPLIATCGAVGGATFPIAMMSALKLAIGVQMPLVTLGWALVTNAALGAGLAAVSLSLARRAPALGDGGDSSDGNAPSIGAGDANRELQTSPHALPNAQPMLLH